MPQAREKNTLEEDALLKELKESIKQAYSEQVLDHDQVKSDLMALVHS